MDGLAAIWCCLMSFCVGVLLMDWLWFKSMCELSRCGEKFIMEQMRLFRETGRFGKDARK